MTAGHPASPAAPQSDMAPATTPIERAVQAPVRSEGLAAPQAPSPLPAVVSVPVANRAPTLFGRPRSVAVLGEPYRFQPIAADPERHALTWSVQGAPTGASFDSHTGSLSFTPTSLRAWGPIRITATDSLGASTSLPPFFVFVKTPDPVGTATLTWQQPTEFSDGSNLPVDIVGGYRIYHGRTPDNLRSVAEVDDQSYSIFFEQLGAGTHYFAVSAISVTGEYGELSVVLSKTIL